MNKIIKFCLALKVIFITTGCAALLPISVVTTTLIASDERSLGVILDDKMITNKIRSDLAKFGSTFLQVHLAVLEGRILLTGTVPSNEAAKELLKIVWSIKGVREVLNELVVALKTLDNSANDLLIEKAVESLLLLEKDLISANYKVSVNNSKVYILGIAQNAKERDKALTVARTVKAVDKVINYIILKNDIRRG
jgi:osmotically-inducible protein OsmY